VFFILLASSSNGNNNNQFVVLFQESSEVTIFWQSRDNVRMESLGGSFKGNNLEALYQGSRLEIRQKSHYK
jgi:hypothetical protein